MNVLWCFVFCALLRGNFEIWGSELWQGWSFLKCDNSVGNLSPFHNFHLFFTIAILDFSKYSLSFCSSHPWLFKNSCPLKYSNFPPKNRKLQGRLDWKFSSFFLQIKFFFGGKFEFEFYIDEIRDGWVFKIPSGL
jgi:hypothetical protein